MRHRLSSYFVLFITLLVASCEKPSIDVEEQKGDKIHVKFNLSSTGDNFLGTQDQDTRTTKSLKEVCTRLNYAFVKDGIQIDGTAQTSDDDNFGIVSADLQEGTYEVVFIAHNGLGNAKIETPEKITFTDNKVTDTFYYYGTIEVADEKDFSFTLKRAVGMFRLIVKDETPSAVSKMKFYYTGGSSTFNAVTGYGCVNSKQTEYRDVQNTAYSTSSQYEIYTFPHSTDKKLKIKISALNSSETTEYERTFENVPIAINNITQYSGNFYGESPEGGRVALNVEDSWTQSNYDY